MSQHAATLAFASLSDRPPVQESAPGRVNLIGEHTDYSGGYVLPLALERRTFVALRVNESPSNTLRAHSREEGMAEISLEGSAQGHWTDYLVGAVGIMNELGAHIRALDVGLASDVPLGAGVSSSAALEVALLRALRTACEIDLDDRALAYAAQRIENQHLGLKTGIMDQMAASLGTPGGPLLFDTYSGETRALPMFTDATFMTFHSGVSRRLVEGAYNERRAATDQALSLLDVERLVDISEADMARLLAPIRPRVRHVVSENARVLAAATALEDGDAETFGQLMSAAHASMRDDFAASHGQVDAQVAAAQAAGALGARITGAGFGGCFVVLAWARDATQIAESLQRQFPALKRVA